MPFVLVHAFTKSVDRLWNRPFAHLRKAIELPLRDVSNRRLVMSDTLTDKLYAAVATDRSTNTLAHVRGHDACIQVNVIAALGIQDLTLMSQW